MRRYALEGQLGVWHVARQAQLGSDDLVRANLDLVHAQVVQLERTLHASGCTLGRVNLGRRGEGLRDSARRNV